MYSSLWSEDTIKSTSIYKYAYVVWACGKESPQDNATCCLWACKGMSSECSVLVPSSMEVEHLCLEPLWESLVSSLLHCWQDSALLPPCAWFPWQPTLKDVHMFTLAVVCVSYSNHRELHTEKCGHFFPVCSNFTDNELADVFQCGVWVNADWGVAIWGGGTREDRSCVMNHNQPLACTHCSWIV